MPEPLKAKHGLYETGDTPLVALESIQEMLRTAASSQPLFPPTLLYNDDGFYD